METLSTLRVGRLGKAAQYRRKHLFLQGELTLALLVAGVGAEHANHALAADDLAVAAHLLD
jgi:hypothetical protein